MTYFVTELASYNGAYAPNITAKNSYNEALMLFHQVRASQLANSAIEYCFAQLVDATGRVYMTEHHSAAAITTEEDSKKIAWS